MGSLCFRVVVYRVGDVPVKIKIETEGLKRSKWHEFLMRFLFGGVVTALAGLIGKKFGPAIGGLFLAFPAIIPATATLIKKREEQKKEQKKEKAGFAGAERGRAAAAVDVAGAAMGGFGLAAFSLVVWFSIRGWSTALVLICATVTWLMVAVSVWLLRETLFRRLRAHRIHASADVLQEASAGSMPKRRSRLH
jgi:hypothetical protein